MTPTRSEPPVFVCPVCGRTGTVAAMCYGSRGHKSYTTTGWSPVYIEGARMVAVQKAASS